MCNMWNPGEFKVGGQGSRTDIQQGIKLIKEGMGDIRDLVEETPELIVKYAHGFKVLASLVAEQKIPLYREVKSILMWGSTGAGKTYTARELGGDDYYMVKAYRMKSGEWFCDYAGQGFLIIDEWSSSSFCIDQLMAYLDGDRQYLGTKGAHTFSQWHTVIITTNQRYPEEFYPNAYPAKRMALFERLEVRGLVVGGGLG